jgi:hypothetical protein
MNQLRVAALLAWAISLGIANPVGAVSYTVTLLHPAGFSGSYGLGVADGSQVGQGASPIMGMYRPLQHALLWNGGERRRFTSC